MTGCIRFSNTRTCTYILIVSPVLGEGGGYYHLVIITPRPPPPCLQTLHRSHDNLKNPYWIAYWYRWEHSWEARWAQSDKLWATQPPPPPPRIAKNANFCTLGPIYEILVIMFFPCYTFVCSVMRSCCLENLVTLAPQDPPNMIFFFFSYFGFELKKFLSDCLFHMHILYIYGWEDNWKAR